MKINRSSPVDVIVNDFSAAKEFFIDLGLDVHDEGEVGEIVVFGAGLNHVKGKCAVLQPPEGKTA